MISILNLILAYKTSLFLLSIPFFYLSTWLNLLYFSPAASEGKAVVEQVLLTNLLRNVKYRYYPTPTLYIYHAKDCFYSESDSSWGKQISLLPLIIAAPSGNEQEVRILCVYVTANWNYFCTLKASQVFLGPVL